MNNQVNPLLQCLGRTQNITNNGMERVTPLTIWIASLGISNSQELGRWEASVFLDTDVRGISEHEQYWNY